MSRAGRFKCCVYDLHNAKALFGLDDELCAFVENSHNVAVILAPLVFCLGKRIFLNGLFTSGRHGPGGTCGSVDNVFGPYDALFFLGADYLAVALPVGNNESRLVALNLMIRCPLPQKKLLQSRSNFGTGQVF